MTENRDFGLTQLQAEGYPSKDWFSQNSPIEGFVNPDWKPQPERQLPGYNVLATNPKWTGAGNSLDLPRMMGKSIFKPKFTLLDVGGGNGAEPFSPLRKFPFYYILDPTVGEVVPPIYPNRAIKGLAEDMPFKDKSFYWVISHRSLGWYPEVINPYWALREMIRVAQARLNVTIGQNQEKNNLILQQALEKISDTPEGQRIKVKEVYDTEIGLLLNP